MVPLGWIEHPFPSYQDGVIPLYYKGGGSESLFYR
jgi:hypothetical protein